MFRNISIPPLFSLTKIGKVFLLLREEYKDFLLREGIEDLEPFLQKHRQTSNYLTGRMLHPLVSIKDGVRMVIRQYRHGGLLRLFTRDLYLLGSRSFQELALIEEILACGIPTIEPIGAIHRLTLPPFYKAYLLSLEVPQAVDLIQYLQEMGSHPSREDLLIKRRIIRSTGLLLSQFHQAGFFHADLQLKNILVADNQPLLIDFDRSFRKQTLSKEERMKNLLRLNRSVEKWKTLGLPITRTDRLRFFQAYTEKDEEMKRTMKKVLRTYSVRLLFYRWSWALQRVLGSQGSRGLG